MTTGDALAQCIFNKDMSFDWQRSARVAAVGFVVTGPCLYGWFNIALPRIVAFSLFDRLSKTQKAILGTAIDQSTFSWWIVSNYLFWVSYLQHRDLGQAVDNVRWNIMPSLIVNWTYWPLIMFLNLRLVPIAYRVITINFASIFWNLYLSWRNQMGLEQRGISKIGMHHIEAGLHDGPREQLK